MNNDKINILGININRFNLNMVITKVSEMIDKKDKFYICFPNAYLAVIANEDRKLMEILNSAKMVIPDGMPLVWYSKTFKESLPQRISGFDFFYNFSKVANIRGYSYFFMGGKDETILNNIEEKLKSEFKNIKVKGYYCPPFIGTFSDNVDENIISIINKCEPNILWVGLSAPKQEKWIYKNIDKLNVKMVCGIGAVFNFYGGVLKRAPKWLQNIGLEWLFRICMEPKRLIRKYLINNTKFLILIITDLFRRFLKLK